MKLNRRKIFAPFHKKLQFFIGRAVKQVAGNQQLCRFEQLYLRKQSQEVFLIYMLRNRNAGFSKMAGLAKMKIRSDQRFFFFPKQTTLGRKPEMISMNDMLNGCLQLAANITGK